MARLGLKRIAASLPSNEAAKTDIPADPPAQAPAHKFTDRQAAFIEHYMLLKNATQAAIQAGYAKSGAGVEGGRLLKNAHIRSEVDRRLEAEAAQFEISRGRWLRECAKIAFQDMGRFIGVDGLPLSDFSQLSADETAVIKSITVEEFKDGRSDKREVRRFKFTLEDKAKGLELIGKRYGWLVEKHDHEHKHQHTVMGRLLDEIDAEGRGRVIEHES